MAEYDIVLSLPGGEGFKMLVKSWNLSVYVLPFFLNAPTRKKERQKKKDKMK